MKLQSINKNTVLALLAMAILIALFALILGQIRSLESKVAALTVANEALRQLVDYEASRNDTLERSNDDLEQQIQELKQPIPVQDPGLFPITRVLAHRGDTVTQLARREKTDPSVIHALNQWLEGRDDLRAGQPIWVPTPTE